MRVSHNSYVITTYKTAKLHERGKEIKEIREGDGKERGRLREARMYSKRYYDD